MSVIERVNTGGTSGGEEPPHSTPQAHPSRRWTGWVLATVLLVGIAAAAIVAVTDENEGSTPGTPTTVTPTTVVPIDTRAAVYPSASSATRHTDPAGAARGFAVDFVGFVNPVVGEFQQDGSQSGRVEVRPSPSGPVTTVMVRRMADSWWVLGSTTPNIDLREPQAMATISSPARLRGISTAFEATVSVEIRQDDVRPAIGEGYVMGGSMGDLGPFDGRVAFSDPSAKSGAIILYTSSMENGNLWEATVVRVRFGSAQPLVPASACPGYSMPRPVASSGQMVVTAYYQCGVDGNPVATYRLAPSTSGVLRAALEALLAGPTAPEREAGLETWFSSSTADLLDTVVIRSGAAVVDFDDLRPIIPNASTSAGSRSLLAQLDATVFQFPSVKSVIYRINGDCEAFTEWLQAGGCEPRTRG